MERPGTYSGWTMLHGLRHEAEFRRLWARGDPPGALGQLYLALAFDEKVFKIPGFICIRAVYVVCILYNPYF